MKNLVLTIVFIATVFSFAPCTLASAILVDSRGSVTVTIPGKGATPAKLGLELQDGALIKTGRDAQASVMFETGAIDKVLGESAYTVGQKQQASERTDLGSGITLAMKELKGGGEGATVHGMIKEAKTPKLGMMTLGGIQAVYPFNTAIRLGSSIKFEWGLAPPVNWPNPVLVVSDENKANLLIKPISAGSTSAKISSGEAKLAKGRSYTWFLASNDGGIKGKSNRFGFKTLSADTEKIAESDIAKIRALDMSEDGKNLLIAQLLYTYKLNDEMVTLLEGLWKTNQTPFIERLLNFGKSQMGR